MAHVLVGETTLNSALSSHITKSQEPVKLLRWRVVQYTQTESDWRRPWTTRLTGSQFSRDLRGDPFNEHFRKFPCKTDQWIGLVQPEKFRKNGSTFWSGPLFPVGPVGIWLNGSRPQWIYSNRSPSNLMGSWQQSIELRTGRGGTDSIGSDGNGLPRQESMGLAARLSKYTA